MYQLNGISLFGCVLVEPYCNADGLVGWEKSKQEIPKIHNREENSLIQSLGRTYERYLRRRSWCCCVEGEVAD